jgi:hypothetical protein
VCVLVVCSLVCFVARLYCWLSWFRVLALVLFFVLCPHTFCLCWGSALAHAIWYLYSYNVAACSTDTHWQQCLEQVSAKLGQAHSTHTHTLPTKRYTRTTETGTSTRQTLTLTLSLQRLSSESPADMSSGDCVQCSWQPP